MRRHAFEACSQQFQVSRDILAEIIATKTDSAAICWNATRSLTIF